MPRRARTVNATSHTELYLYLGYGHGAATLGRGMDLSRERKVYEGTGIACLQMYKVAKVQGMRRYRLRRFQKRIKETPLRWTSVSKWRLKTNDHMNRKQHERGSWACGDQNEAI